MQIIIPNIMSVQFPNRTIPKFLTNKITKINNNLKIITNNP